MLAATSLIKTASSWYCWATSLSCICSKNTSVFEYCVVGIVVPQMRYWKVIARLRASWKVTENVSGIVLSGHLRLRYMAVSGLGCYSLARLFHTAAQLVDVSDDVIVVAQSHQFVELSRLTLSLIQPDRLLCRYGLRLGDEQRQFFTNRPGFPTLNVGFEFVPQRGALRALVKRGLGRL